MRLWHRGLKSTGHVDPCLHNALLCNQHPLCPTICHEAISHNLPRRCSWWASPAAPWEGMRRSPGPPAPHSPSSHSPSDAWPQRPRRPPGWWCGPSWWLRLRKYSWLRHWWNPCRPLCHLTAICWSYLWTRTDTSALRTLFAGHLAYLERYCLYDANSTMWHTTTQRAIISHKYFSALVFLSSRSKVASDWMLTPLNAVCSWGSWS